MAAPLGYDLTVQQLIPGYASLARLSVALLAASPLGSPSGAPVLVAGCGTGAELVEAQAQRPDWQLWAIDPSNEMLQAAKARLGEGSSSIHWQQTTVEALDADSRFCGALSVLVLQSLPDDGSKLAFLTALARSLEPGGQLVLVDLMAPERSPPPQPGAGSLDGLPKGQWPRDRRGRSRAPDPGSSPDRRIPSDGPGQCGWLWGSSPGVPGPGLRGISPAEAALEGLAVDPVDPSRPWGLISKERPPRTVAIGTTAVARAINTPSR